ncbi:MAG: flavodoxin family protein [Bacteroidales bacterium]
MKNILVISASARKEGNSDLLCDSFIKGAKENAHQVEKIFLNDRKINYCTGCGYCFKNEGQCSQKDDMGEIYDKMIKADVIVMATPIYFYTMNGQMKTFIDRMCSVYRKVSDKDFYFIMCAADTTADAMDRAMEEFRGFTSCLEGASEKGILCGTSLWERGDVKKSKYLEEAYEMGKGVK